jgi:hypothetical protein
MPTPKLTAEIVNAAILGMEAQKEKLDAKIAELVNNPPAEPGAFRFGPLEAASGR